MKNGLNRKRKKILGRVQRLCGAHVHKPPMVFEEKKGVPLKERGPIEKKRGPIEIGQNLNF